MNKLIFECQCHGKHYIEVEEWDEGSGQVMVAFVGRPANLWQWFQWYWKHRTIWVNDLILDSDQRNELSKRLKV